MTLRSGIITGALGFMLALLCSLSPAAAGPVVWNLVETTCTSHNGGCQNFSDPVTIGWIEGSGTYLSEGSLFSETGSFQTNLGDVFHFGSSSPPYCPVYINYCSIAIDVTSGGSGVFGSLYVKGLDGVNNASLGLRGLTFAGSWGSDSSLIGCGTFASCEISGVLVAMPEPSSASILIAALLGCAFVSFRARRRAFPVRAG
jgi:hypothetical protein